MRIAPNVNEQSLIISSKLAEQQKNQRAIIIKKERLELMEKYITFLNQTIILIYKFSVKIKHLWICCFKD